MRTNIFRKIFPVICVCLLLNMSCRRFIEVDSPITSTNTKVVYSNDATAIAVLTGIYVNMNFSYPFVFNGMSVFPELSADNLKLFALTNQSFYPYYKNALEPLYQGGGSNLWLNAYQLIYVANAAIEGLNSSTLLTPQVKQQLLGEAFFMRGFFYFYLVNLFGDVPLALTTDYNSNSHLLRESKDKVYTQILADLKQAEVLLNAVYPDATLLKETQERIRPCKAAASAMLARISLYTGDYKSAEAYATKIIDNKSLYDTVTTSQVFFKNTKETIWSLQPVVTGENTKEARFYTLTALGPNSSAQPVYLSPLLMNSFENGDRRKTLWTGQVTVSNISYPFASKYKVITQNATVTEYSIVLRVAEQYLIRAEARANLINIQGAQDDLNVIRRRAGLSNTTASSKEALLPAILQERRVELFCEWGHRWFDLKRTDKVNEVMTLVTPTKDGGTWKSSWQYYPVPQTERNNMPQLSQNQDYPL